MRAEVIEQKLKLGEQAAGHAFKRPELLSEALAHRSYANEKRHQRSDNDRLEFLGDAVLDLLTAELIFTRYEEFDSGEMTKIRASLVSEKALATLARQINLGEALFLGVGEQKSGGAEKPSLLADAYEALVAAVYLDGGLEAAWRMVLRDLEPRLEEAARRPGRRDYKSKLQEFSAKKHMGLPQYTVLKKTGPDHDQRFLVECCLAGCESTRAEGPNVKSAEQAAARVLYDQLRKNA